VLEYQEKGQFEIAREPADISFDRFYREYFLLERPVIIEGIAGDHSAIKTWNRKALHQMLSREPSSAIFANWYVVSRGAFGGDYPEPELVSRFYDDDEVYKKDPNIRVWIHRKGNESNWHYDGVESVFNLQVTGAKEWWLASPATRLISYPFTGFSLIGDEQTNRRLLQGKTWTRCVVNAGDLLYLPPLWYHRVISLQEENLNLTWAFTKKKTDVYTETLGRELDRWALDRFFAENRVGFVRKTYEGLMAQLPPYVRIRYHHPKMVEAPYKVTFWRIAKRLVVELATLPYAILHAKRIAATVAEKDRAEPLDQTLRPGEALKKS
jgi:hypothetical protein